MAFLDIFNLRPFPGNALPRTSRFAGSGIETLESRIAPAALAVLSRGTLLLTGYPDAALHVTQVSEMIDGVETINTSVSEGANLLEPGAMTGVKNIVIRLDPAATAKAAIDISVLSLSGSITVFSAKSAATDVSIAPAAASGALHIGGSILLKGGLGDEYLVLGNGLHVGGGLVFPGKAGTDSLNLAGAVSLGRNVGLNDISYINIGAGSLIEGSISVANAHKDAYESIVFAQGATVTKNFVFFGGPNVTSFNAYGSVGGRFFAALGEGRNVLNLGLHAGSVTVVGGSAIDEIALLGGNVTGSLSLNLVGADNKVFFDIGPFSVLGDLAVGKNLTINAGSGSDNVRLTSAGHAINVAGKTVVALGNGANVFTWNGASAGTAISISTGSGADVINVYDLDAPASALRVAMGDGNDRLVISSNFARATLDGGKGSDQILNSVLPSLSVQKGFGD